MAFHIACVWWRFTRVFLQQLIMSNDTIVGKVKSMFYRCEFQGLKVQEINRIYTQA